MRTAPQSTSPHQEWPKLRGAGQPILYQALVALSLVMAAGAMLYVPEQLKGIAMIDGAVYVAVMARILQAQSQHRAFERLLSPRGR
ncbi:hypothetical protein I5U56_06315 [Stenotrophomonas maltophilia]|nr:hypothetical protein [Stenotrophomonas maltophilia]